MFHNKKLLIFDLGGVQLEVVDLKGHTEGIGLESLFFSHFYYLL